MTSPFKQMMKKTMDRVQQEDPTQGDCCVNGSEINICVHTSYLVIGVVLEKNGKIDKKKKKRTNDTKSINLAELDATIKCPNLALQGKVKRLHIHTKAENEMLVR